VAVASCHGLFLDTDLDDATEALALVHGHVDLPVRRSNALTIKLNEWPRSARCFIAHQSRRIVAGANVRSLAGELHAALASVTTAQRYVAGLSAAPQNLRGSTPGRGCITRSRPAGQ